jgi:hypothetical protein
MAPTIFIVPGIYEGTEAFEPLVKALKNLGHDKTVKSGLRSTGTSSKPGPGIKARDDVESIAKDMARAVEDAGDDGVVGLFHSAGGWIGSAATKGLTAQERKAAGQTGGVKKILFLASALFGGGNSNSSGSDTNSKGPILMPFMEKNVSIQACLILATRSTANQGSLFRRRKASKAARPQNTSSSTTYRHKRLRPGQPRSNTSRCITLTTTRRIKVGKELQTCGSSRRRTGCCQCRCRSSAQKRRKESR